MNSKSISKYLISIILICILYFFVFGYLKTIVEAREKGETLINSNININEKCKEYSDIKSNNILDKIKNKETDKINLCSQLFTFFNKKDIDKNNIIYNKTEKQCLYKEKDNEYTSIRFSDYEDIYYKRLEKCYNYIDNNKGLIHYIYETEYKK